MDETEDEIKKLMHQIDVSCVQAFHTVNEIDRMVETAKTGWYPQYPSTVEQIRIMNRQAAGRIRIKAAGGIRSLETISNMQKAGCTRFGLGMKTIENLMKDTY